MTNTASLSQTQLKNRRKALSSRRRKQTWQAIWRFLLISTLAGGLIWLMILPKWTIKDGAQIEIEGNQLLSKTQIRALLANSYPQSLWRLKTEQLVEQLKATPPIADARVTRQLLPPKLTITVKERQPVAIALAPKSTVGQTTPQMEVVGFLDRQGILLPQKFYPQLDKTSQLPALKVTGFVEAYRSYWSQLYEFIRHSPVKVFEVDWRDPSNLVLKTELGTIYCGAYSSEFPQKLTVLARLETLTSRISFKQIVYIDLSNPDLPVLQLHKQPSKPTLAKANVN